MDVNKNIQAGSGFWKKYPEKRWLKIILLLFISGYLLFLSIRGINSYPNGDGPEYVLMTEALYNHLSPEIRFSDYASFKRTSTDFQPWDQVGKYYEFDIYEQFIKKSERSFRNCEKGLFTAHNDKNYFFHFFAYSFINVPVRAVADLNHFNPMRSFQVTNSILIIITCFFLLFYSPFKTWPAILVALSFVFSSVYWYIGWPSPEVFTTCLVTLAFWFYFQGRRYIPVFLLSLAAMQNQPIVLLAAFISLAVLIEQGITIKNLVRLFLANSMALLPAIFYLVHFDTTNLIKDSGILDWGVVTWNRVWGFYMDLNQGMILAIPILLIVYPVLWLRELIHGIKNREFRYDLLLPFFLLAMISIFCTMINWNHGMAVINRYATWSSAVLMIHGFFMMKGLERVKQSVLLLLCFFAQVISVLYNNRYYNHYDWDQNLNKPWAEWAYENFSSLYNPDPNIFFVRTSKNYNFVPEEGPIVYLDKKGIICKTLVHKDYINKLTGWGVPASKLNDLKASKIFRTGWLYFNKGTLESTFTPDSLLSIRREERVKAIINEMPRHKDWYNSIKLKAAENNISVEEMMRRDALYLINEEKK